MKITIEKVPGIKTDQHLSIFAEIFKALDILGRSGELIEHIGVNLKDKGDCTWQLVASITFIDPPNSEKKEKRDEKKAELLINPDRQDGYLTRGIIDKTDSFIKTRIYELGISKNNLESYSVPVRILI